MDAAARAEDEEMLQLFFPEAALNWLSGAQMGSQEARQAAQQAPGPAAGCDSSSDAAKAAGQWPAAAAPPAPPPANGSEPAAMELDQQQQMQMQQQLQQLLQQQLYQQQQKHLQEQQREQQELQALQRKQQQLKQQLQQEQQQRDAAGDGSASAASAAALGGSSMYGSMPERGPAAASSFTAGRASSGSAAQQQQQHDEEPEPDLSRLSVMQRYHARRKLSMQRMERQVQEKLEQLGLLEQENRRLKWRAHILENMLLDIDKQLEVMSASDAAPDANQWLTLLGMGGGGGGGPQRRVARTVHRILEGASSVDVSSWSVADCRKRWLAFLQALKPLVEEAEAAQAAHRAAQPQPQQEQTSSAGSRRPRRAAAAAAAAVIQQEAADVLGVAPLRSASCGSIPQPPPPPPPPSSSSAMDQQQDPQQLQQAHSGCSSGSDGGSLPPAHAASVEGVPAPLLARIDELVLTTFYWLLAMMSTQPVLTYEFISTDLLEGVQPLPPQEAALWSDAISRVRPSLEQMQECSSCIQVSRRCMAKVLEERAEIQASMAADGLESEMHSRSNMGDSMLQLNSRDAAVERMRYNVRKESVVRNMVGFYCINVFSLFQLAQVSLACSPWFCMAWRVVGAVEERLAAQLAEPAPGSSARPGSGTHNTRSSARLAAQR